MADSDNLRVTVLDVIPPEGIARWRMEGDTQDRVALMADGTIRAGDGTSVPESPSIGLRFLGAYDSTRGGYNPGDVVTVDGVSYLADVYSAWDGTHTFDAAQWVSWAAAV
jgi:hypothetical protein